MKKGLLGLLILAAVALMLAACQPAAPTEAPTEEPMEEATEEPMEEATEEPTEEATEEPMEETEAPTEEMMAAPEDEWGVVEIAPGDPVRLGVNVVTSGAGVDVLGLDELRGAELAVADFGDFMGHAIEIVHEDTLCSAEGGQTAATKTVADPSIVAVVGHTCSSSCTPAAEIYTQAHYTMMSPSCTAPALTAPDTGTIAFTRTAFNDLDQGKVAAEFAYNELGARAVATIHDGSPYAEQLVSVFSENFQALGGEVVAAEAVNVGDTDMRPVLTTIAATQPDLIYVPIFPAEGGFIAVQRADVGLGDTTMMGADGLWADTFLESAGDAAEGVYVSGPGSVGGPAYEDFLAAYQEEYGEEPPAPFHAHTYDAATVLLNAAKSVAVEGDDGTLYIGRKALSDAVHATQTTGLIGDIDCTSGIGVGDCGPPLISVLQVQGGEFTPVYTSGQ
jgi:branched-chain amino acid transport system substrate-binding protein